jgi:parallel beta-helix repeat protein
VSILDAKNNIIGGTLAGEGNLVSGNTSDGVEIFDSGTLQATGNKVSGNFIGTNFAGTGPIANGNNGVAISGAANNTVGGTTGERAQYHFRQYE